MRQTTPYLIFPGTCRDALAVYAECFKGKVTAMTTFADSPLPFDSEAGDLIFDSELRAEGIRLRASDSPPGEPVEAGSNFALFVAFSDVDELKRAHATLALDGQEIMPVGDTPAGGIFAMVGDRFGVRWMLSHHPDESNG